MKASHLCSRLSLAIVLIATAPGQESHLLPGARAGIDAILYPSLQAALDALGAGGGLVRLPAGRFEIDQPLILQTGDVCLQGAGTATQIVNTNTEGRPALILQLPEAEREGDTRLWRIRLADFAITGNPESGEGIVARRINELFIDGLTVSRHGGDGLVLDHCYEDPRICQSLITYNGGTGLNLIGCHDIVVAANQFEENRDGLRCVDGFNLCMTGNCLDDHLGQGVVIENTYGSVLAGNMIEECAEAAVVLDRDCYGITVSANVIAHNGAGIDLRDAHGCAISGNTFTIMKSAALRVGDDAGRLAVTGNSFGDSYIGDGRYKRGENDREAAGVTLGSPSHVTLVGNNFSGLRPRAVTVEGEPEGLRFEANTLADTTAHLAEGD